MAKKTSPDAKPQKTTARKRTGVGHGRKGRKKKIQQSDSEDTEEDTDMIEELLSDTEADLEFSNENNKDTDITKIETETISTLSKEIAATTSAVNTVAKTTIEIKTHWSDESESDDFPDLDPAEDESDNENDFDKSNTNFGTIPTTAIKEEKQFYNEEEEHLFDYTTEYLDSSFQDTNVKEEHIEEEAEDHSNIFNDKDKLLDNFFYEESEHTQKPNNKFNKMLIEPEMVLIKDENGMVFVDQGQPDEEDIFDVEVM